MAGAVVQSLLGLEARQGWHHTPLFLLPGKRRLSSRNGGGKVTMLSSSFSKLISFSSSLIKHLHTLCADPIRLEFSL